MKNKNIYWIAGVVVVILIAFFAFRPKTSAPSPAGTNEENGATSTTENSAVSGSKQTQSATKSSSKQNSAKTSPTISVTAASLPALDFIDKRIVFPLKDFPNVKITIEKVVFGRGDTVKDTGCTGILNADFSAYLYPGSICISDAKIDGSPRGIVAIHALIENNGGIAFGGSSDLLKLNYSRPDSAGNLVFKFAYPLKGLASYYINGFSSKEMVLSYLVPEDQLVFNLVSGYKDPAPGNKDLNVYNFSTSGLLVDFGSKSLKIIK